MANSSSKGMTIGIVVLVVLVAFVFIVSRHKEANHNTTEVSSTATAPAETKAPDTKAAETDASKTTGDATKAADSNTTALAPAPSAAGNTDLTSASGDLSDASKPGAEAAKTDDAAKPAPAPADEKKDTSNTSSGASSTPATASGAAATSGDGSLLSNPTSLDVDIDKAMADRSMGRDDAPVTMIEYASLTCPHCAHFSKDLLPIIKEKLIDTGKLRLIYRDYPLDKYAMRAAMMARCADPSKYFDLIEVIFQNQERWARSDDPVKALVQLGSLAGMSPDFINACMNNEELQNAILNRVEEAKKNYKVNATPTFVFNDGAEQMSGDHEVEDFVAIVNKLTGK